VTQIVAVPMVGATTIQPRYWPSYLGTLSFVGSISTHLPGLILGQTLLIAVKSLLILGPCKESRCCWRSYISPTKTCIYVLAKGLTDLTLLTTECFQGSTRQNHEHSCLLMLFVESNSSYLSTI
jgi:hypothetical protein